MYVFTTIIQLAPDPRVFCLFPQLRDSLLRTITGINPSPTVNIHAYMECVALDIIAAAGL